MSKHFDSWRAAVKLCHGERLTVEDVTMFATTIAEALDDQGHEEAFAELYDAAAEAIHTGGSRSVGIRDGAILADRYRKNHGEATGVFPTYAEALQMAKKILE